LLKVNDFFAVVPAGGSPVLAQILRCWKLKSGSVQPIQLYGPNGDAATRCHKTL